MKLLDVEKCENRLDTSQDLNNKTIALWGTKVGMGDWANMSHAFCELKIKFPYMHLGAICGKHIQRSYLQACGGIDWVVSENDLQIFNDRYDINIGLNIQLDDKTLWKNNGEDTTTVFRQFTEMGLPVPERAEPKIHIPSFNLVVAKNMIDRLGIFKGKFIIHHCGAMNPMLRWPHEYVKDFVSRTIKEFGMPVAVIGLKNEWGEEPYPGIIDLTGDYSILTCMAFMEYAGWFVGGHSGFNCIGGGLPIKMLSLYPYKRHHHMWSGFYKNSYDLIRMDPLEGNLLQKHTPDMVFNIFKDMIEGKIELPMEDIFV